MGKEIKFLLVTMFILVYTLALNCGGNSPSDSCDICVCGSTPVYVPLDNYCLASKKWDQNCCKCIASRLTSGNSNFMSMTDTKMEVYLES